MVMQTETARDHQVEAARLTGEGLNWVSRHPGIVLLGVLALALIAMPARAAFDSAGVDSGADEIPLFI